MLPKQYIKGFATNQASFHELEPGSLPDSGNGVFDINRDGFLFLGLGLKPDGGCQLVIVLDTEDGGRVEREPLNVELEAFQVRLVTQ